LGLNTIEGDDTPKDKIEAIAMHSRRVGKQKHLLLGILLIFSLEDHYMIGLLGQQNHINIVKQCLYKDRKNVYFFVFFIMRNHGC
jgi:hypothetical protein